MSHYRERGPVNADDMNNKSVVKVIFDSALYDFKTLNNTVMRKTWTGTYTGMVSKASGLPSGFGKYYANHWIFDG